MKKNDCKQLIKVLHYVSRMDLAGQETFIMNVFRNIDTKKISFDFLCTQAGKGDYDDEILKMGGQVRHIQLNRIKSSLKQIDNTILLYRYLRKCRNEYKVFHIHTQHAMDAFLSSMAAKFANIEIVIVHSHNTSTIYSFKSHNIFKSLLGKMNIYRFACSHAAGQWMFGKDEFKVICNGVDIDKFKYNTIVRDSIRKELLIDDKFVIGHIGRFNKQKNHKKIIEVFYDYQKENPDTILILFGKGELEGKVIEQVKSLGIIDKVIFAGTCNNVEKYYNAMDLFLFPSLFEGLPVVLVEAQVSGLKCVISNTITKEIDITDGILRIDINQNSIELANKLSEFIEDKTVRYTDINRIRKSGYDIKLVAKELEDFYTH